MCHEEGMYPNYVQRDQHLNPGNHAQRLEFCKWLNADLQLHRYVFFCYEAQFTRDCVNNTSISHLWS